MTVRKELTTTALLLLFLTLCLLGTSPTAISYPGPGDGYKGWTAEVILPLENPRHVQMASSGGYLYIVADNGSDVYFYRTKDKDGLSFGGGTLLDRVQRREARDPYVAAWDKYVAVGWKEFNDTRWSHVIAFSSDHGATWTKYYDGTQTTYDNYEPHLWYAGNKVHAAYVSNYPGRLEVYYKRFTLSGQMELVTCVSGDSDGVPATQPCVEAESAERVSVYYVRMSGPPNPVWQAWTSDSGRTWHSNEILSTQGVFDHSWPEVDVWMEGQERRAMVVADALDIKTGDHKIFYSRYYMNMWERNIKLVDLADRFSFPQISTKGNNITVVYRQSGGSLGLEGAARINTHTGEFNSWKHIDDLFYNNLSYDNPGSMDVCSDGSRFYVAQAGTGNPPLNRVLVKREDDKDPTAVLKNPGKYQRGSFKLEAEVTDDFTASGSTMLGPSPFNQAYDQGIVFVEFRYRFNNGAWQLLNVDSAPPWETQFNASGKSDGEYDFWLRAYDTAKRYTDVYIGGSGSSDGIILDRVPPQASISVAPPDGENGWYVNRPPGGIVINGSDSGSGIDRIFYRFGDSSAWSFYQGQITMPPGVNTLYYYAMDRAGNSSQVMSHVFQLDLDDPEAAIAVPSQGGYFRDRLKAKAFAQDRTSGVASFVWLVDGRALAETEGDTLDLDIASLADGAHFLEVEVKDRAGRRKRSHPVTFYKDSTPPSVVLSEPAEGAIAKGRITLRADASDNLALDRVTFTVDGKEVGTAKSAPFTVTWDTYQLPNGEHRVEVVASDKAGNRSSRSASARVYVANNLVETAYFAEGCTRDGFETWLCLQNPGRQAAFVTVEYYLGEGQGTSVNKGYVLPPLSRTTVYVNGEVGPGKDVSMKVVSDRSIVAERPVYFTYRSIHGGIRRGGHVAKGVGSLAKEWFFAEGCTREGFDTWLCLQNPWGEVAEVRVSYMMEGGLTVDRSYLVAPRTRYTVMVNREVGPGHDVSMKVNSSLPLVAERPVYFLYQGMWDGGHNVMGALRPETRWYFAEGCTRTGFSQWLCFMNPGDGVAKVKVTYLTESGLRTEKEYRVPPRARYTVNVNQDVPRQHDLSALVVSDRPIVAERPMYFLYASAVDEGSCAMGVNRAGSSWYLAEGCTRPGFDTYICLFNPGDKTAEVRVRYMMNGGFTGEQVITLPPMVRRTIKVDDVVGEGWDVSAEVTGSLPVVVERPVYAIYRGKYPAGDTLSGYSYDP